MDKPGLLLVDDDPLIRENLVFLLRSSFTVHTAETRKEAIAVISNLPQPPELSLVDLGLPPYPHDSTEGFALIPELLAINPNMRILVLSGQNEDKNLKHAMTIGAADFIPKPCEPQLLKARLEHQLQLLSIDVDQSKRESYALIGDSPAMVGLRAQITQFANTDFPVLITGESGTGKELIATQLHNASARTAHPYIAVNCAAFSSELLASQLFGHAKGAFTGATREHNGFFAEAKDGTLFLDEIGEMSISLQSNLLRVIENGEYYRIGESRPRLARARIIAASNKNLLEEVRAGRFREDLYYRLCVLSIKTPPLRERYQDKIALLTYFQNIYSGKVPPFELDDEAEDLWLGYVFPGNVRELRNIIVRLGTKYPGQTVSRARLQEELESSEPLATLPAEGAAEDCKTRLKEGNFDLDEHIQKVEWQYIQSALQMCDNNLSHASKLLNVNRTTLYSKIQRLESKAV
ncbi:MAG: sigma-54 dependent transcriptional regulator [Gammaproteobacteria bacterium]|nr:sigma-54 dependent transcriptional regulator [Gammaproteobacteria bacterium]